MKPVPRANTVDRRSILTAVPALLVSSAFAAKASSHVSMPLWPDAPPGSGGPDGPVRVSKRGAWSHIAPPSLEIFMPSKPDGSAMLVAAGGGYKRIEMEHEAYPAALWLAERGIVAFTLAYRLPGEGWAQGPLAPLQDAQRALRLIRARAATWGIDPRRLGVLGFSAGGHLMGLAATRSDFRSYERIDEVDDQSARPANAALIYPVITLEPPYDKTSTRRVLIGRHPSAAVRSEWSVETHVRAQCPPIFLAQAEDDQVSDPANTLIMASACRNAGVPVALYRFASGGHGFAMGRPGTPTTAWPSNYEAWLRGLRSGEAGP